MTDFKPVNILFGNNKDNNDFIQCIFELTLKFNDSTERVFREISYSKYCNLITIENDVKFNTISKYKLKISIFKFIKDTYIIEEPFTIDNTYVFKNDDIYIEFMQNEEGLTNCCCNLIALDNNRMFITPPNY
jgi:hypothetical protein